jgi:uncharacterized protein YggE
LIVLTLTLSVLLLAACLNPSAVVTPTAFIQSAARQAAVALVSPEAAQAAAPQPAAQVQPLPPVTPPAPQRTISVSGSGKTTLTPDIAYISIGVHTENKDAAKAVSENTTKSKAVIDALKGASVATEDIRTTNFSIYPQQQYDTAGKPTGEINYVVENTVYVTVRKLDTIGGLLNAAVKAGANNIGGIQFDVSDRTAALSSARKAAVADAKAQADELAKAAGVAVGDVMNISASISNPPIPQILYAKAAPGIGGGEQNVPVSAGQMSVIVDVSVVYAIK